MPRPSPLGTALRIPGSLCHFASCSVRLRAPPVALTVLVVALLAAAALLSAGIITPGSPSLYTSAPHTYQFCHTSARFSSFSLPTHPACSRATSPTIPSPHHISFDLPFSFAIRRPFSALPRVIIQAAAQGVPTPAPAFTCQLGTIGRSGVGGFTNGAAGTATLNYPFEATYDPYQNALWVADSPHLRRVDLYDHSVTSVFVNDHYGDGPFASAGGKALYSIAMRGNNSREVIFTNNGDPKVRRLDPLTGQTHYIAGSTAGFNNGVGGAVQFQFASSVRVLREDPDVAYVTDEHNHVIRKIDIISGTVTTASGTAGSPGYSVDPAATLWRNPFAMSQANGTRRFYVSDGGNHVVRLWDTVSGTSEVVAGDQSTSAVVDGPALLTARFAWVGGQALANGVLYIGAGASARLRAFVLFTDYVVSITSATQGTADGATPTAQLWSTHFVVADCDGTLYVSGYEKNTLRTVKCSWPSLEADMAQSGLAPPPVALHCPAIPRPTCTLKSHGQSTTAGSVDGTTATATFNAPMGVQFDPQLGTVWFAEPSTSKLRRYNVHDYDVETLIDNGAGTTDGDYATAQVSDLASFARSLYSPYLYAVFGGANSRIRRINTASKVVEPVVGSTSGFSDGIGTAAKFRDAVGMVILSNDVNVAIITDKGSHTLRKLVLSTTTVSTVAGADLAPGFNAAAGTASRWNTPHGITTAIGDGCVYIGDSENRVVRLFDTATGSTDVVAGRVGVRGTVDGPALTSSLEWPAAVSRMGNVLYMGSSPALRALLIDRAYVVTLTAPVFGHADGAAPGTARLQIARFISAGCDGALYFSDQTNHQLRSLSCEWPEDAGHAAPTECGRASPRAKCRVTEFGTINEFADIDGDKATMRFYSPWGMAYDPHLHSLFVHDASYGKTKRIDLWSETSSTFATTSGYNAGRAPNTDRDFYIVSGTHFKRVDVTSGAVTILAGSTTGHADGIGAAAAFRSLASVALSRNGEIAILPERAGCTIRRVVMATLAVDTVGGADLDAGFSTALFAASRWNQPFKAVAGNDTARNDQFYIGDSHNYAIRTLDLTAGTSEILTGAPGENARIDGPFSVARFAWPGALTLGRGGIIYVGDGGTVRAAMLRDDFVVTLTARNRGSVVSEDQGIARFSNAHFMEAACDDTVFVSDYNHHLVRRVECDWDAVTAAGLASVDKAIKTPQCESTTTVQCEANHLGTWGTQGAVDGDNATVLFTSPWNEVYDEARHVIWVSDNGRAAIRKYDLSSGQVSTLVETVAPSTVQATGLYSNTPATAAIYGLYGISPTLEPWRRMFLQSHVNSYVRFIDFTTETINPLIGGGANGNNNGVGAAVAMNYPCHVRTLPEDPDVSYIMDRKQQCIRRLQVSTATTTTLSGVCSTGVRTYTEGTLLGARWFEPYWLTKANGTRRMYASDVYAHAVRLVDIDADRTYLIAGTPTVSGHWDGPALRARLTRPTPVTINGDVLYIGCITPSLRALIIPHDYVITLTNPTAGAKDGLTPQIARFRTTHSLDVDRDGDLWVGDYTNRVVRRVKCSWPELDIPTQPLKFKSPEVSCNLSSYGTLAVDGFRSGPRKWARMSYPSEPVYDFRRDIVWFGDGSANALRYINLTTDEIHPFIRSTSDTVPVDIKDAGLPDYYIHKLDPTARHDRMFVTLQTGIVRVFDFKTNRVTALVGQRPHGTAIDGIGAGARFSSVISDVKILQEDSNTAYLVDRYNHLVRTLDMTTLQVTTVLGSTAGFSTATGLSAQMWSPFELVQVSGTRRFIIADMYNHVLRMFDTVARSSDVIVGKGTVKGHVDGPGLYARMDYPAPMALHGNILYIGSEHPWLKAYLMDVDFLKTIAHPIRGERDGPIPGTDTNRGLLHAPHSMNIGPDGDLWIGDYKGYAIRRARCGWKGRDTTKYTPSYASMPSVQCSITTIAGVMGDAGDVNGPLGTNRLKSPYWAMSHEPTNSLLFIDGTSRRLRRYNKATTMVSDVIANNIVADGDFASAGVSGSYGIHLPNHFSMYGYVGFSTTPKISVIDLERGTIRTIAGSGIAGHADGIGTAAQFNYPTCIEEHPHLPGFVFVCDRSNHVMRQIRLSDMMVSTVLGTAGTAGFGEAGGTSALLNQPYHVIPANGTKRFYLSDFQNHIIRLWDTTTGATSVVVGTPEQGGSRDGFGRETLLKRPTGIQQHGQVIYIGAAEAELKAWVLTTDYVITLSSFEKGAVDGAIPGPGRIFFTHFMETDCDGSIYISDYPNHAVRKVTCEWDLGFNLTTPERCHKPTSSATPSLTPLVSASATVSASPPTTATMSGVVSSSVTVTASSSASATASVAASSSMSTSKTETHTLGATASISTVHTATQSSAVTVSTTRSASTSRSSSSTRSATIPLTSTATVATSPTRSLVATGTVTGSQSHSASASHSGTMSGGTASATNVMTATATRYLTASMTSAMTASASALPSATASGSLSRTSTSTFARSSSASHVVTVSPSKSTSTSVTTTGSATGAVSRTRSSIDTSTPTAVASASISPAGSVSTSATASSTMTLPLTKTLSMSGTATPANTATLSGLPTATQTAMRTASGSTSASQSATASSTQTAPVSGTPSVAGTSTLSAVATSTITAHLTATTSGSVTPTPPRVPTQTAVSTNTTTVAFSATLTRAGTATQTSPPTSSLSPIVTVSSSTTQSKSHNTTATVSPPRSASLTNVLSATMSRTRGVTASADVTTSLTASGSKTQVATATISQRQTASLSTVASATISRAGSVTASAAVTATATVVATRSHSLSGTVVAPPTLTGSPVVTASVSVFATPTASIHSTKTKTDVATSTNSLSATVQLPRTGTPSTLPTPTISYPQTASPTLGRTATPTVAATVSAAPTLSNSSTFSVVPSSSASLSTTPPRNRTVTRRVRTPTASKSSSITSHNSASRSVGQSRSPTANTTATLPVANTSRSVTRTAPILPPATPSPPLATSPPVRRRTLRGAFSLLGSAGDCATPWPLIIFVGLPAVLLLLLAVQLGRAVWAWRTVSDRGEKAQDGVEQQSRRVTFAAALRGLPMEAPLLRAAVSRHSWLGAVVPCHALCGPRHVAVLAARVGVIVLVCGLIVSTAIAQWFGSNVLSGGHMIVACFAALAATAAQPLLDLPFWIYRSATVPHLRRLLAVKAHEHFEHKAQDLVEFGVRRRRDIIGVTKETFARLDDVQYNDAELHGAMATNSSNHSNDGMDVCEEPEPAAVCENDMHAVTSVEPSDVAAVGSGTEEDSEPGADCPSPRPGGDSGGSGDSDALGRQQSRGTYGTTRTTGSMNSRSTHELTTTGRTGTFGTTASRTAASYRESSVFFDLLVRRSELVDSRWYAVFGFALCAVAAVVALVAAAFAASPWCTDAAFDTAGDFLSGAHRWRSFVVCVVVACVIDALLLQPLYVGLVALQQWIVTEPGSSLATGGGKDGLRLPLHPIHGQIRVYADPVK